MLVRLLQPENALLLIEVTPLPIVTLVRLLQYANALSPIEVTPSGIVTLVSFLQPENAPLFNPVRTRDTVRTLYKHNIIF